MLNQLFNICINLRIYYTIQDDLKSTLLDLIDKMQRKKIFQFNKVVIARMIANALLTVEETSPLSIM